MEPLPRLTRKQDQLVAYVYWYTNVHRIPPAEKEIATFLEIQGPSAHQVIPRLETKGCIGNGITESHGHRGGAIWRAHSLSRKTI